jgi:uncharacterized protein YecE (DUF72 family)
MYKGVTHFGKLTDKDFLTTEFLRGVLAFKEHLGPIFIQVSDAYSPRRRDELFEFLNSLPTGVQFLFRGTARGLVLQKRHKKRTL